MRRIFNSTEQSGFLRACLRKPLHIPVAALELAILIYRRGHNQIIIWIGKDKHVGLKKYPSWLPKTKPLIFDKNQRLNFPYFHLTQSFFDPKSVKRSFSQGDKEAYFQINRWAGCLEMALANSIDQEEIAFIKKWIASPPPKCDDAWETYSCCERIANLSLLLTTHPKIKDQFNNDELIAFYVEHGNWIANHLEYYGIEKTNNHFLNNGRALIIAGSVLNYREWIDAGVNIFKKYAPLLFGSDGFLREGSSHYQFIVAAWYFDGLLYADKAVNFDSADVLAQHAYYVGAACQKTMSALSDMVTHIGDISPDFHPKFSVARLKAFHAQWLSNHQTNNQLYSSLHQEWLFARTGADVVVARWVTQWPSYLGTHSHADLGSFVWQHQGNWILVDPGRVDYTSQGNTQLLAKSHNTILINGMPPLAESVLNAGIWYPRFYSQAQIETQVDEDAGLSLTHNGFSRCIPNLVHFRKVSFTDEGLNIVDELRGTGLVKVELVWNFPPEFTYVDNSLICNHEIEVDIINKNSQGIAQSSRIEQYAYSEAYGMSMPAHRIIVEHSLALPCVIETRFHVSKILCAE